MDNVCEYGWKRRGDQLVTNIRNPYIRLTVRQIIEVVPFLVRYIWYWLRMKWNDKIMFINSFQPLTLKPTYGVPCGGIGSGAIGRDFRGGFCKFSLRPGLVEHSVGAIPADQFIVTVRRNGCTLYQQVLNCAPKPDNELKAWKFEFPGDRLQYTGLYPRAWTVYQLPECNDKLTLICRQISPVLPHDYRDTCLPTCNFIWTIINHESNTQGDAGAYDVSITFTFRNGTGLPRWADETVCRCRSFDFASSSISGISLEHTIDGMRCSYGLATTHQDGKVNVSRQCFDPTGSGKALWLDLLDDGVLDNTTDKDWCYVKDRRELAIALCAQTTVTAGSVGTIEMSLSWDMPIVLFGGKRRPYARRYTRWFGQLGDAAPQICAHALRNYRSWEDRIDAWQRPVLDDLKLPSWYKSALFNELYFLTDGGTCWFLFNGDWRDEESHLSEYTSKRMKEFGRFAYLESWEYRMMNTYDVHFYASYALASLWPEVEVTIQAEFRDQIFNENTTPICYHFNGEVAPWKTKNRVPHDLGNPAEDPWLYVNAYAMHNTASWRDLNLKFILTCYRDYLLLSDEKSRKEFLEHVWPAITVLIDVGVTEWDSDGDGMIENSGTCDQTYDAWKMYGTSAYCGGLWLGALKAALEIGRILQKSEKCRYIKKILKSALVAYHNKLWQGDYYKFDENSRGHKSIMADQLCGYWYLKSCGLAEESSDELLPQENVQKALKKIYEYNVQRFKNGELGAVNGIMPNGQTDWTSIQSVEVWTGITYAVSSHMILEGMIAEGFHTAGGLYRSCFEEFGMQYQTPEAIYARRNYRAIGYMRPLAIWAMQWAMERGQKQHGSVGNNSVKMNSHSSD